MAKISSKNALLASLSHTNRVPWILINYELQEINEAQLSVTNRQANILPHFTCYWCQSRNSTCFEQVKCNRKTIIFTNDKITTRRKRYLHSDLTSEGQCSRLKRKWRKPIKKVNTLKQKLQLFYNIKLSNATRRRYISIFMCYVSQRAR